MGMLRSILGVRWDNFVRNTDIRDILCRTLVFLKFRRARMTCLGHVERIGEERQLK